VFHQDQFQGGRSEITELLPSMRPKEYANVLRAGKLPWLLQRINSIWKIVGPSLGQEAISSGFFSL